MSAKRSLSEAKRTCPKHREYEVDDPLLPSPTLPWMDIRGTTFGDGRAHVFGLVAEPRLGRRTARTFPLFPPPQKNRSPPSDSSPDTPTPGGISSFSSTCPVRGSTRLTSLSSPSQVPCQSSPSIQVTPDRKR